MSLKLDFREQLRKFIESNANPPHKYGHQPRLYQLTREIGQTFSYDDDVVYAAVWMHDLGVFVGHRPDDPTLLSAWDHVAYTNARAPGLLLSMGFPEAKVPAVLEVILHHQPQDDPQTLEAIIVRDADILEQLGAIGILRTASKIGSDNRFVYFRDAQRSLTDALARLPTMIRLETTRQLAAPRIALVRAFLEALEDESYQELG